MPGKDTRIVQMQFDNKSFERNIATSQKSLDRFKKELNFDETSKGLKDFLNSTKALAFDALSNNIQKLTDKFTGLGNAGEFVLSRIRASLESAAIQAERFVKSMTLEQIQVGQNKYDALTRSVQTIVASGAETEEKAYSIMERVMEYTNQTSHNFETMVGQISSLTSIGVPLTKAERYMESFANASTKAGADASKAAVAMQVYAKAMGSYLTKQEFDTLNLTARVVTKEWREELLAAGVAAGDLEKDTKGVIKTAKKYGNQVEVTVDNIENTLNKKWAGRKTLSIFAERYSFGDTIEDLKHPERVADSFGKTAFLTGQRALTFADGLNAVKEAISSGWMETYRIIFGDLTDAMNLFTGACNRVIDVLSGIAEARNAVLRAWGGVGGRDTLIKLIFGEMEDTEGELMYEGAYGIIDIFTDIGNMVSEAFYNTFKNLIPREQQDLILKEVNRNFRALGLDKPFETFDELWNSQFFIDSGGRTSFLGGALEGITSDVQKFIESFNAWFNDIDPDTGLSRLQKIQNVFEALVRSFAFAIEIGAGVVHFFDVLGDQDHLGPAMETIMNLLSSLGLMIIDSENDASNAHSVKDFFDNLAETLKPACELVNDIVAGLSELILAIAGSEDAGNGIADAVGKIAGAIRKVFNFTLSVATPVVNFVKTTMSALSELFKNGVTEENIEVAKKKISDAFSVLVDGLGLVFKPLFDKIRLTIQSIWEVIRGQIVSYFTDENTIGGKIIAAVKKVILPVYDWLKDTFTAIINRVKEIYEQAKNGVTMWDIVKLLIGSLSLSNITARLGNLMKNGGLMKIIMGALGVVAVGKAIHAFTNVAKVFGMLKQFFTDPGYNIVTLIKQGVMGEYEWFSDRFLNIAKSIGRLVEAVAILGFLDTGKMIQGILGLAGIMAAFGGLWLMIGQSKATWGTQMGLTTAFTGLVASISMLVLSLTPFIITDWGGMFRGVLGLGLVIGELLGFMALTSKFPIGTGQLGGFIAFAFSIQILLTSMIPMMLTDWGGMLRAVTGLGAVLAEIVGFMWLLKALGLSTLGLNMKGIYKFASSIGILMFSLIPFMLTDWNHMIQAVSGLGIVLAEIVGFMWLLKALGLSTMGLNMKGMYKFAQSIGILMFSLVPFMLTDWGHMLQAVAGLAIVMAELLTFMVLMKKFDLSTMGLNMTGMAKFALSIGILMLSIIPLLLTDWSGMFRAVVGLGLVLGELLGFMALARKLSLFPDVNLGGFIGFAASIGILMLALIPFILTDWDGMFRAIVGLGLVLTELGAFMALMEFGGVSKHMKVLELTSMIIALGVMVLALTPLMIADWDAMWRSVVGLGLVMLELLTFMAIVSVIPSNPAGIAAALAIAIGLGVLSLALSAAMNEVRNIRWEVITAFTTGLAAAMLAMAGAIVILSAIPLSSGLKGIALLAAGIAAIIGVISLMVPFALSQIGTGAMDFSAKLEIIAGLLSGFTNKMAGIDEGGVDKANTIFDKLRTLMGKLYGWGAMKGDLNAFSYAMFVLGTGIEIFNSHVSGVVSEMGTNGEAALTFIQDLSGCANDLDTIAKMNFDALIARISGLGGALYLFAKGAKDAEGLDTGGETPDVSGAMNVLRAICEAIEEDGGFTIPDMPSEDALGVFGAQLAALAMALVSFEEAGSQLGNGTKEALRTLDFFKDLKLKLMNQDFLKNLAATIGIFDKEHVTTDQLTQFGNNIEQLGLALKKFAESTTTVDETTGEIKSINLDEALNALDGFAKLQGKLGFEFGPLIQLFVGRNRDLNDLSAQIEVMGTAISDVVAKLAPMDENGNVHKFDKTIFDDALEVMSKVEDHLKQLQTKLGTVGGLGPIIGTAFAGRSRDFTDLQIQMEAFAVSAQAIQSVKTSDPITTEELTSIYDVIDNVLAYLERLQKELGKVGGLEKIAEVAVHGRAADFTDLRTQITAFADSVNALNGMNYDKLITTDKLEDIYPVLNSIIEYLKGENGLSKRIGNVGGAIRAVNEAFEGHDYNMNDLKNDLTDFAKGVGSLTTFNVDSEGKTIFNPDETQAVFDMLDGMISYMNGLGEKLPKVGGIGEFLSTLVEGRKANFEDLGRQLGALGTGLGSFYKNLTTEAGGTYDYTILNNSLAAIASMVSILRQMAFMGDLLDDTEIREGFSTTVISNIGEYMYKLSLAMDYLTNGNHELGGGKQFDSIATKLALFVNEFKGALDEFGGMEQVSTASDILNNVSTAIANLVKAARDSQLDNGAVVDFSTIGLNIANGCAQGIRDGTQAVIDAAVFMAQAARDAAKAALDEHSPSKVFQTIGEYASLGMAEGVTNKTGEVSDASTQMADSMIESSKNALALFASLMAQDIDANPTITPILDLSNVTAGSALIDNLLTGEKGFSLSGAGSGYTSNTVPGSGHTSGEYRGQDLSWIKGSIDSLGARIDAMSAAVSNMQIVLDSGALAGAVTDGVNKNLGAKTTYRRRRN